LLMLASAWKENWAAWVLETGMRSGRWSRAEGVLSRPAVDCPDQAVDFVEQRWMLWLLRLAPAMALTIHRKQLGNSSYQSD